MTTKATTIISHTVLYKTLTRGMIMESSDHLARKRFFFIPYSTQKSLTLFTDIFYPNQPLT